MRSKYFTILLLCVCCSFSSFAAPDTVSVFFPFNESSLSDAARDSLDAAMYKGTISATQSLQITGYTDVVGSNEYNLALSQQRANAVKEYLLSSGFSNNHITLIIGKGKAYARQEAGPDGNPADRRVDIVAVFSKQTATPYAATPKFEKKESKKLSKTDFTKVSVGEIIVLDNIYFIAGRHVTRSESEDALNDLYNALEANPEMRISIEGHVCCVSASAMDAIDDDTHNMELSVTRARAIRDYLVQRGLDPDRFEYSGFGHRRPVVSPETSEEDADKNRRVEIRVIK